MLNYRQERFNALNQSDIERMIPVKHNVKAVAALILALLLTACTGNTDPVVTTVVPQSTVPAAAPETMPLPVQTEPPTQATEPFQVEILPVITESQTSVTVRTPDEFLASIAPNTEIVVDTQLIDWSKAAGYGKTNGAYYRWEDPFDGPQLVITGVSNLTIRSAAEDHTENVLSAVPRYAYVVMFENCSNIHVKGLTVGHTEEPGYCLGGVLGFRNCQDILVEDCGLYGCGTVGVMGMSSRNMQVINSDIYECSVAGAEFTNCDDVNVDGCTIRDIGTEEYPGIDFRVYGCGTITCNGEPVHDFSPRQ